MARVGNKPTVNQLFDRATKDNRITKKEAASIGNSIKKGGVTKDERAALKENIALNADAFDAGAKKKIGISTSNMEAAPQPGSAQVDPNVPNGAPSAISQVIGQNIQSGFGLTEAQKKIFAEAGVDPNSEEGKSMKLQMMMANYKNNMEMASNVGKMLSELGSSIIRNIRA